MGAEVIEVDELERESVDGDALHAHAHGGREEEEALLAGDGAARDDEGAGDEDAVEQRVGAGASWWQRGMGSGDEPAS